MAPCMTWLATWCCAPCSAPQDEDRLREPPTPATPIDFPVFTPPAIPLFELKNQETLGGLFASVRYIYDLTCDHAEALNLKVTRDVPLEQLVPSKYLPPTSWQQNPAQKGGSDVFPASLPSSETLSNGAAIPSHEVYFTRMKELLFSNEDAFRFLQKLTPLPDHPPVRLVQFRKFWDNLAVMAQYWDTSLDNDTSLAPTQADRDCMDVDSVRSEANREDRDIMDDTMLTTNTKTYTGRRIGTGRDMPEQYRDETVRTFVETVAWAFGCRVERPRVLPKLKMQNLFLPVRQTGVVYRSPKDRSRARHGFVEGPLIGIQCRGDTSFRANGDRQGEGKGELADLLREVGAMLLTAQERAREGQEEPKRGEGKWWAHTPRWGGGLGGEVCDPDEKIEDDATNSRKRMRKPSVTEAYKSMKPPLSTWDKRVTYMQIGREKGSEYDEIYMISSILHHISILHLRVHPSYLAYLTSDTLANQPIPAHEPWFLLQLHRSRWYDLLVAEDRLEAMRGVWGIVGWMMRDLGQEKEEEGRI